MGGVSHVRVVARTTPHTRYEDRLGQAAQWPPWTAPSRLTRLLALPPVPRPMVDLRSSTAGHDTAGEGEPVKGIKPISQEI